MGIIGNNKETDNVNVKAWLHLPGGLSGNYYGWMIGRKGVGRG